MTGHQTVIVLAKEPVPGRVKTRLCPPLSHEDAARLAAAALVDTLGAVAKVRGVRRVLALDGQRGDWVPRGFDVVPQVFGGLDERIAAALDAASGPAVLVGMDTPQLAPTDIELALAALDESDAVVGPALDGGYWLLGVRRATPRMVRGVPMSTAHTYAAQLVRLDALGLATTLVRPLRDVDDYDDALAVAATAPGTRFAETLRAVESQVALGAAR